MQKYSIVIPIGEFSFFVFACLKNIFATAGVPQKYLDVVFITSAQPKSYITEAFEIAKKQYQFRVITTPFDAGVEHQLLLDYALKDETLTEVIIVQHCDLFWQKTGWLKIIQKKMQTKYWVGCVPLYLQHYIDNKPIVIVGDFFGVYRREKIKQFSFRWGRLQTDIPMSNQLENAIKSGRITSKNKKVAINDWMDGSVALSLELMTQCPERILIMNLYPYFVHLMAFFRIQQAIHIKKKTLIVQMPFANAFGISKQQWANSFAHYSYFTSFIFDKQEVKQPLPWSLFEPIAATKQCDLKYAMDTCKWIAPYGSQATETIGMSDCGIHQMIFGDEILYNKPQKLF